MIFQDVTIKRKERLISLEILRQLAKNMCQKF